MMALDEGRKVWGQPGSPLPIAGAYPHWRPPDKIVEEVKKVEEVPRSPVPRIVEAIAGTAMPKFIAGTVTPMRAYGTASTSYIPMHTTGSFVDSNHWTGS